MENFVSDQKNFYTFKVLHMPHRSEVQLILSFPENENIISKIVNCLNLGVSVVHNYSVVIRVRVVLKRTVVGD